MSDASRVRDLTTKALDEFDTPGKSVSALVRQAHRIAVLRHDYVAQVWFCLQVNQIDANGPHRETMLELKRKLVSLMGEEAGGAEYARQAERYFASRTLPDSEKMDGRSIDQIESVFEQLESAFIMEIPSNLTPIDTYYYAKDRDAAQSKLIPLVASVKAVLSKVRQAVYDYLVATEAELDSGREDSRFFEQVQARINGSLVQFAPEAAESFVAAQDRINDGGREDISHALTSCRRMIKSLADALYPATNAKITGLDGIERKMSDEAYKNRLLQYVRESVGKHKNGAVLQSLINDLGSRLNALDALASKGVHADPSLAEAHTCVVQTYLLAGDLLNIAEGTSPHLRDTPEDTDAA